MSRASVHPLRIVLRIPKMPELVRCFAIVVSEMFTTPRQPRAGFATGASQTLAEWTATLETHDRVSRIGLQGWLEFRHDHSSGDVFTRPVGGDIQNTPPIGSDSSSPRTDRSRTRRRHRETTSRSPWSFPQPFRRRFSTSRPKRRRPRISARPFRYLVECRGIEPLTSRVRF